MDTIAYAVLLFSVVKSCQMANTESNPGLVNKITLVHFLVLMSDFVSTWFKHYSIYLAGERREETSNFVENSILSVWENRFGRVILGLVSEGYFLYEFIDFNFSEFLNIVAFLPLRSATAEGDTILTDLSSL